jgi:copper transport protein
MSPRGRTLLVILAAMAATLALPAAASAHAVLRRSAPLPSNVLNSPPARIRLTYSEAVEPRFAIVSVTDAAGRQRSAGPPRRSPTNPDELDIPLHRLAQGWYLVFWRAISVDGHPVRGAFTFAVGPNPGPAPQFAIPSVSEAATTTRLLVTRWIAFLSIMAAIGIFALRVLIARPLVARVAGTRLRALSVAFWVALVTALVATPIYVLFATAQFALRSALSVGALVPLLRVSAFGRAWLHLELVLALFGVAAAVLLWLDRPERRRRSIAELLAGTGAAGAAAATLLAASTSGHAAQTAPRALALALDWLHLVAGSIWIGGLIGLLVLWRSLPVARRVAGLAVCVPRFSRIALLSVIALIGSGIGASLLHLPTLTSLWQTSYGKALVVKIALLLAALALAGVNLTRTTPRLQATRERPELGPATALVLRRLVGGEVLLVAGALFAAAVLSSIAPPAKAIAQLGKASATVGPGPVASVMRHGPYRLEFHVQPNRAAVPNSFAVRISRAGMPVTGADVTATLTMLDMAMGSQAYHLSQSHAGLYQHSAPALVMVGRWGLSFEIQPPGQPPFDLLLVDHAAG